MRATPRAPYPEPTASDDPLTDDALTGAYRIWQRKRGHRFSLDDVLTAREALRAAADPVPRYVDLGCGIGSVLLMVHYALTRKGDEPRVFGVEAQELSYGIALQNIARNNVSASILHGDLRELELASVSQALGGRPTLVTGTPPYMPPGTSTPSPDSQRAHARVELRGGIEDYLSAMGKLLAPGGRAIVCGDARRPERAYAGAAAAGLRRHSPGGRDPARGPSCAVQRLHLRPRRRRKRLGKRRAHPLRRPNGVWTTERRLPRAARLLRPPRPSPACT